MADTRRPGPSPLVPHDHAPSACALAPSHRQLAGSGRAPHAATMRRVKHATRAVSLGVVLLCVAGTMAVGTALKSHCAGGDYSDGRQYHDLCYSDIVPLLSTEQLTDGRLPFLDSCDTTEDANNCDEYPV